jgi:MoaA/NifB/PqqE/SkfB family radical SAM enzyme
MINFPGRKFVNTLLPREAKENCFRVYNLLNRKYSGILNNPIIFKNPNRLSYPKYLALSLTTRCNLRCTICDREGIKTADMNFGNVIKLRNPIKYAKMIDLTGWGEAILYPKYADVVKFIFSINNRKKLISQTTNGALSEKYGALLKGRLQRLVISLNAATPETYNREMRGGNFDKTISSVKTFLSMLTSEDRKVVKLHFVVHVNNYKEMPLFIELAKTLNVSQVSFGQYMSNGPDTEQNTLLNIKSQYNNILRKVDEISKKYGVEVFYRRFGENLNLSPRNCMFPYDWCFVTTNGDMTPCCYLGDISMGNVFKNSFESVWFGENIQRLRKSRYLPSCLLCASFHPFDNSTSHFTSMYNMKKIGGKVDIKPKGRITAIQ